jgi:hypothetical protein
MAKTQVHKFPSCRSERISGGAQEAPEVAKAGERCGPQFVMADVALGNIQSPKALSADDRAEMDNI